MSSAPLTIGAVGDVILDAPDPDSYFVPSLAALRSPDVLVGHVEIPHTLRGYEQSTYAASTPVPPEHLEAMQRAGFSVATLAGNHIGDRGAEGVADTLGTLRGLGLATAGAGMDIAEARQPAIVERHGHRVGVLSLNCVGPDIAKATSMKAGAAYIDVHTVYGEPFGGPGGAPTDVTTLADRRHVEQMAADVRELRTQVDTVVVALHKGVLHVPVVVADYERDIARAAIDAGADAVIGHHAHILKGIEFHRGRPILHGLGNFVTVTGALRESPDNSPERRAWAARRRRLTGFDPDPSMPRYPFHPESRNTLIALLRCTPGTAPTVHFVPCWIDGDARPVPVGGDAGERVVRYVERISQQAGFAVSVGWDGTTATVVED